MSAQPPRTTSKDYRIRPLKRGDREAVFRLLAADGWAVPAGDQETSLSWVVQHPEMESYVAHDATSFSRVFAIMTMTHRPQLRLGGRLACIDLFVVAPEHRHKGIGSDLMALAMRRVNALGCKRIEVYLPPDRDDRLVFFENNGFTKGKNDIWVRIPRPAF